MFLGEVDEDPEEDDAAQRFAGLPWYRRMLHSRVFWLVLVNAATVLLVGVGMVLSR